MLHFQHPALLYSLLVIPILTLLWIWLYLRSRRRLEHFADKKMLGRLIPDNSRRRPHLKFALLMLASAFLIIAVANPQVGSKMVKGERMGCDVAVCLDISNSMMAEDIQPNRLDRAKRTVTNLMSQMAGDRVSLILFAGSSYIQMPLTNDYSATKLFLDQVDCNLIASQGTAIGDAIEKAMQSFGYGDSDREWVKNQGRAIIVISDGENFEDNPEEAAKNAADEGIIVCTIGMGLPEGVPLPEYAPNGERLGYRHDKDGNIITTQLNEQMLMSIADEGNGIYVRGGNINSNTNEIIKRLEHLEKSHFDQAMFSEYESRYAYPLIAALLCLVAELLIFERRNRRLNLGKLFFFALLLLANSNLMAQSVKKELHKGNRDYKKEHYDEAETRYRKALEKDSTYYRGQYNLGNALYKQKRYDEAAQHYSQARQQEKMDNLHRSQIFHNEGNSHLQAGLEDRANGMQHFQQAVDCYKEALKLNSKNDDTRYNLSYAKKLLAQAQNQQQNQQNKQNQDKQDQQNKQNQDKQDQQNKQNQDKQDQQDKQSKQNKQDQQKKQQNRQKQESPQDKQKKQDAERILNAVKNNEKNSLKEHQKQLDAGRVSRTDKDW